MASRARGALEIDAYVNLALARDRFSSAFAGVLQAFGLSEATYNVLWILRLSELDGDRGGVPMSVIARGLLTAVPDVTRLVDRLVEAGWVERRPSSDDRRVVLARLQPAGRRLVDRASKAVGEEHGEQWAHLSSDELATLDRLLVKAMHGTATANPRTTTLQALA